jgi:flagellar motor switch/type III secretory pathway protein FliN
MFPSHMATTQQFPPPAPQPTLPAVASAAQEAQPQALVQVPAGAYLAGEEPTELTGPLARLPIELDVAVPVREFKVRNLLALEAGHVIESQWPSSEDLPLASGAVQLAWTEFEVIETDLAVRITRLP